MCPEESQRLSRGFISCRNLWSAPNILSRFDDPIQFSPHFVFAHDLGVDPTKATLRAQGQLLERQVASSLIDASLEFVEGLQIGALGCDETQDNRLAFWNESQGLKAPGSFAVVFQQ